MSLGKRLFIGEAAAVVGNSETADIFGDTNGIALYTLDYDASDESGNYDGTSTDVTFGVDGQINWGASFNGSSSKIDIGSNIADVVTFDGAGSTNECTLSFWVQPQGTSSSTYYCVFSVGYGLELYYVNNKFTAFSNNTATGTSREIDNFQTTSTYSFNEWHHVVFVFTPTSQKWYINGSLDGSNTTTSYTPYPETTATIGTFKNTSPAYDNLLTFDGLIDHVRIFDRVLDGDEVSTLYGETATVHTATTDTVGFPSSASSNMFAYYKLDGSGEDESSNNHDGTEGSSMAYSFGRFGTAGSFDGSNNAVITIPDSDKFSPTVNDFSVSLWFNVSNTATNRLISKGDYPYEWELWVSNGQPVYVGYSSQGASHGVLYGGSSIYADGNWHHIVVTHDYGTKMEMFVDNVSLASLTTFTGYAMSNTTSTVTIGKRGDQSTSMTGMLDQIRFYDKILTTDEIEELYNEKQAYITKNASDPFGDGDEEAFYKFDNNTNDSTGSYNMTNRNITFSTDSAIGTHSGEFNGTSAEGVISSTATTPVDFSAEDFTISFWIKVDNFTNTAYPLSKWGANSTNDRAILASIRPTGYEDVSVYEHDGTTYYQMIHSQTLEADRWYHIAYTRNGSTGTIYVDGVGESFARTNSIKQTAQDIFIGNAREDTTLWFNGHIDSMRFFSRCLDGDEVFKLYAEVLN